MDNELDRIFSFQFNLRFDYRRLGLAGHQADEKR